MPLCCPYCQQSITLKGARPGRYTPRCAKCGEKFLLVVPDGGADPTAAKLPASAGASGAAETVAPPAGAGGKTVAAASPSPGSATTGFDVTLPAEGAAGPRAAAEASRADAKSRAGVEETLPSVAGPAVQTSAAARAGSSKREATDAGLARSPTVADGSKPVSAERRPGEVPPVLGGYRIVRRLGQGAMGAVYLARQMSLDRDVALKVIQPQWTSNAAFVARFVREAYAAAQLTHHNVVQVYDMGSEGNLHFFSMEFVRGESLADLIARESRLDTEVAVGYVLQAARGLKFAHDHGMVHRDVKPANLLLNQEGIVKVADLGLVKTPGQDDTIGDDGQEAPPRRRSREEGGSAVAELAHTEVTLHRVAMGTPAYMAPEQATDAARVDHRADIYSLGCTLYVLLTGKPPFEGSTAVEVMSKHKSEPVVRPDAIVKRIPKELADITLKMVAKKPSDRYASLDDVIRDLEKFLGVQPLGTFSPREEHLQVLESSVQGFNAQALAKLRPLVALVYILACLAVFLIGGLIWRPLAGAALGMIAGGVLSYFLYAGWRERTFLFDKTRAMLFAARITDWLTMAVGALLAAAALYVLGALLGFIAGAIVGALCGIAFYYLIDRRLAAQRAEAALAMENLLKTLRLKGLDEVSLRGFVARFSGDNWEEFYETLFGYEAKLQARDAWGQQQGRRRKSFRAWRDPMVRWIDGRLLARRQNKDRKMLRKVQVASLQAQGIPAAEAQRRAENMAQSIVEQAAELRAEQARPKTDETPEAKRARIKAMLAAARRGEGDPQKTATFAERLGLIVAPLSAKARFLAGALLLAGCVLWAHQNQLLPTSTKEAEEMQRSAAKTLVEMGKTAAATGEIPHAPKNGAATKPLALSVVPAFVTGFFDSFNAGIAGALLLFSAGFCPGYKHAFFAWPAAAVALLGPHVAGPVFLLFHVELVTAGIGIAIYGAGVVFGRLTR
ncbi:MAG: serine/threonine protein kinase [Planctomycetia bacterium]|nr:serine/threonine protein kinase [Planctomycetia bacterium]